MVAKGSGGLNGGCGRRADVSSPLTVVHVDPFIVVLELQVFVLIHHALDQRIVEAILHPLFLHSTFTVHTFLVVLNLCCDRQSFHFGVNVCVHEGAKGTVSRSIGMDYGFLRMKNV